MHIPFDSMPAHSRLWIYQSNRAFLEPEKKFLENELTNLCEQWEAHGTPLHSSFTIQWNQFIILAVDEQQAGASGCSIDGCVHKLHDLQSTLGLDLFGRDRVAIVENSILKTYDIAELKTLFNNHTLTGDSFTFNNLVPTKNEWEKHWLTRVKDSWLARYLPKVTVGG